MKYFILVKATGELHECENKFACKPFLDKYHYSELRIRSGSPDGRIVRCSRQEGLLYFDSRPFYNLTVKDKVDKIRENDIVGYINCYENGKNVFWKPITRWNRDYILKQLPKNVDEVEILTKQYKRITAKEVAYLGQRGYK